MKELSTPKKLTIAVDFDGCLTEYNFPKIGEQTQLQKKLLDVLIKLQNKGHKIFVLSKDDKYKKNIQKNIKFIQIPIDRSPISIINDFLLIIFFFKIFKNIK